MKKKLLFVIDSLTCAGAEKSLVTLLPLIDYKKYDVDLQLLSYGGEFEEFIPKQVNLLNPLKFFKDCELSLVEHITSCNFKSFFVRIIYSIIIRLFKLKHADKARILWYLSNLLIRKSNVKYDVAIAYAHNLPTFYVSTKVNALKKLSWVNVDLHLNKKNAKFQDKFYSKFTNIIAVSQSSYDQFTNLYPQHADKCKIIYDILNPLLIQEWAKKGDSKEMNFKGIKILTVARLNKPQKGYDISLETCKILQERGILFKWYALGKGPYKKEMEEYIELNGLSDSFILLGTRANPYPYFRACDLYVQTSRHEGFGLSIAEARMLNKPVVTTEFDAVWNQMVQGKNGIVVPIDAVAVANAIQDLIENPNKMKAISEYQRTEKKGNLEELEKFYKLINS